MTVTINGTTGITTPALDNQGVAVVNRTGNGTLIDLQSDGTTVGSIGINGNEPYFTTSDGGFRIAANGALQPATSVGGVSDALEDLGSTAGRWRDLYLSGGVYLGGTGAANYLDDYEEGTWTPIINVGSVVTLTGSYVKIGKLVTLQCTGQDFSNFTSTDNIAISGLPFISGSQISVGTLMTRYFSNGNNGGLITYITTSSTDVQFYQSAVNSWNRIQFSEYTAVWDAYFTITYFTA